MTVNDKVEVKTTETSEPTERLPDAAETMPVSTRIRTPWTDACTRFRRNPVGMASAVLVAALFLLAVFGPYITPFDPENHFDYDHLNEGPSAAYWFGVDSLGRDVFSRILAGTRISLFCGFFSVLAGALIGAVLGLLAGYYEGWIDRIVSRVSDVLFAFPGILLAIGIVAVLAIFSVPAFARLVRANVLYLKHETYVEAARSIGASDFTILFRHIFPGTVSVILVYLSMRIGTAIITAASLSFLGLGAQPPTPEWGAMLNEARADLMTAPHTAIFAVLAIFLTVLAFNLLGDALRDAFDPKSEIKAE